MLAMNLSQIEKITDGVLKGTDSVIHSVVIDSRKAVDNALFVAIKGEHVDGHEYLDQALSLGATGALVEKYCASSLPQIKVSNSIKAVTDLAKVYRNEYAGIIFSITGSCGKTSTKEMLLSILSQVAKVSATKGNQNNEIGVPLTLLAIDDKSKFAIIEMGAAEKGDITYLMEVVRPDITVITNVRTAHIGRFGSEQAIAETKSEIYTYLKSTGKAVINLDEKFSTQWQQQLKQHQVYTYSLNDNSADVYVSDITTSSNTNSFTINYNAESIEVNMQVPGVHNIANALCASTCAIAVGVSLQNIADGLQAFSPVPSRLQKLEGVWGGVLIDDTYNANPASVKAAIDVLAKYPGRRILVLGDMAELGETSKASHSEIGAYARENAIDMLFTCGKDSSLASDTFGELSNIELSKHFVDKKILVASLLKELATDDVVLVKGSRSAALEEVVEMLNKKEIQ